MLQDPDPVVVQTVARALNVTLQQEPELRYRLIELNGVTRCVQRLASTTDEVTAKEIVNVLYCVSDLKTVGCQAIVQSGALYLLVALLNDPQETATSYSLTIIHNVLLTGMDQVKHELRGLLAIEGIVGLLQPTRSNKYLAIALDCLNMLCSNKTAKNTFANTPRGCQYLVAILKMQIKSYVEMNAPPQGSHGDASLFYPKLLLSSFRLLATLANVCKVTFVEHDLMSALSVYLQPTVYRMQANQKALLGGSLGPKILDECLKLLRNVSDAASQLTGLDNMVESLINLTMLHIDQSMLSCAAHALCNLTYNNETNKKVATKAGLIRSSLNLIANYSHNVVLVDSCITCLRHLTGGHSDTPLAHDQIRVANGIKILCDYMITPMTPAGPQTPARRRSWNCVRHILTVIKNLCQNPTNAHGLRQACIINNLMQVLFEAYNECSGRITRGVSLQITEESGDTINLSDIIEFCSRPLLILAKDPQNQVDMRQMECISFFVTMFYAAHLPVAQKVASSLLAELSVNPTCLQVILNDPYFESFVHANFCNSKGQLLNTFEAAQQNAGPHVQVIVQNLSTILQRMTELKNQQQQHIQQQYYMPNHFY